MLVSPLLNLCQLVLNEHVHPFLGVISHSINEVLLTPSLLWAVSLLSSTQHAVVLFGPYLQVQVFTFICGILLSCCRL